MTGGSQHQPESKTITDDISLSVEVAPGIADCSPRFVVKDF